jgi:hypothetical protein
MSCPTTRDRNETAQKTGDSRFLETRSSCPSFKLLRDLVFSDDISAASIISIQASAVWLLLSPVVQQIFSKALDGSTKFYLQDGRLFFNDFKIRSATVVIFDMLAPPLVLLPQYCVQTPRFIISADETNILVRV